MKERKVWRKVNFVVRASRIEKKRKWGPRLGRLKWDRSVDHGNGPRGLARYPGGLVLFEKGNVYAIETRKDCCGEVPRAPARHRFVGPGLR